MSLKTVSWDFLLLLTLSCFTSPLEIDLATKNVKNCYNGACDLEVDVTVSIQQPKDTVILSDKPRQQTYDIDITDAVAHYVVHAGSTSSRYDSTLAANGNCFCPPAYNSPATQTPCLADSKIFKNDPNWEMEVPGLSEGNFCTFQMTSAQCCISLSFHTAGRYTVKHSLAAKLDYVQVTYKKNQYKLKQGIPVNLGDIEVTLNEFVVPGITIDSAALVIDAYGRFRTLPREKINMETEYDLAKAGYWKQDKTGVQMNLPRSKLPRFSNTLDSTLVEEPKLISFNDIPDHPYVNIIPTFSSQPGIRVEKTEIYLGEDVNAEHKSVFYSAKNPGYQVLEVRINDKKERLCMQYPIVCVCDAPIPAPGTPTGDLDMRNCLRYKVLIDTWGLAKVGPPLNLDSTELITSVEGTFTGAYYELKPTVLNLHIQSETFTNRYVLGDCRDVKAEAYLTNDAMIVKTWSEKAPCAYLISDDEKTYYVGPLEGAKVVPMKSNLRLLRVRDFTGEYQIKLVTAQAPESFMFRWEARIFCFLIFVISGLLVLKFFKQKFSYMFLVAALLGLFLGLWSLIMLVYLLVLWWVPKADPFKLFLKDKEKMEMVNETEMKNLVPASADPHGYQPPHTGTIENGVTPYVVQGGGEASVEHQKTVQSAPFHNGYVSSQGSQVRSEQNPERMFFQGNDQGYGNKFQPESPNFYLSQSQHQQQPLLRNQAYHDMTKSQLLPRYDDNSTRKVKIGFLDTQHERGQYQ